MGGGFGQSLAHVAWWVLHICGVAAVCALPTDLVVGADTATQRCLVAAALGLNLLAHYAVRFSDPGWASPPGSVDVVALCGGDSESAALLARLTSGTGSEQRTSALCPQCGCLRRHSATVHCRYCDRCVEGFDHHCTWLGVCVGARNHHLFARYVAVQGFLVCLGFHYSLTACGRPSRFGYTWTLGLLALMGLLLLPLSFLTVAHVFLVLTGQTSRQVMQRFRVVGRGSGQREEAGLAQSRLAAGVVLQNCTQLLCGVRPGWLLHSAWVQRAGSLVARAVNNPYYSCC